MVRKHKEESSADSKEAKEEIRRAQRCRIPAFVELGQ